MMKEELEISGLSRETSFRDAAMMIISHRLTNMLVHEAGVREGVDIEALHDMRVYSRRSREALKIFEACSDDTYFKKVYRKVRNVTRSLGEVRNLDVFISYFESFAEKNNDDTVVPATAALVAWAKDTRNKFRKSMVKDLDELKPEKLVRNSQRMLRQPQSGRNRALRMKDTVAYQTRMLMRDRLHQVEVAWKEAVNAQGKRSEELHALRIAFKKLRYAIEVLYISFDRDKLDAIYNRVKGFQDVLGDIHDADVFNDIVIRKHRKAEKKGEGLLSAGFLAVSSKIVASRHQLDTDFRNMEAEYPFTRLNAEIEQAYIPIQSAPNKRVVPAQASEPPAETEAVQE